MAELITAFCSTLEDQLADDELVRQLYAGIIESTDMHDGYHDHDLEHVSEIFLEVYSEYLEDK